MMEDFHVINTGPLPTDFLALYLDGKEVDVQENGRVPKSVIYVVVGVLMNGISRVLACHTAPGTENLDEWKKVMRSLIDRGFMSRADPRAGRLLVPKEGEQRVLPEGQGPVVHRTHAA